MNDILIYDNIHGYIEIDPIAKQIIDTKEFQRLRRIKQSGVVSYVFPTAINTRFEHSIGVYHLAKQMIIRLRDNQPELNINDSVIKVISIAGLCHDLGHMMFSHLYDDYIEGMYDGISTHEDRSIKILDHIIDKYNIDIKCHELDAIGDIILCNIDNYYRWNTKLKVGKFLFQIVANKKNNIDVDKFDYINRDNNAVGLKFDANFSRLLLQARVINDEICYPKQTQDEIFHMFFIRYQLHKTVYTHKTVKAIELLITQIIEELQVNDCFNIVDCTLEIDEMIKLTDNFIYKFDNDKINQLLTDIDTRNLPKLIYENITNEEFELSEEELKQYGKNIKIVKNKIGYVSGNENPLNNITYYNTKTNEIVKMRKKYSLLTNDDYREYIYRIYKL